MFLRRFFAQFGEEMPADLISHLQAVQKVKLEFTSPYFESLSWLYGVSPCFPLRGEQVEIIHEPHQFYEILVQKSAEARKRIVLASLYLGTGHLENAFIQSIRNNLQKNNKLKVKVLLDFTRGTRGEMNSRRMLQPLMREFADNFQLSMYHTPDLRGIAKRFIPARWNELVGLQHMKVYLFDNSVVISGANLSNDYFTNRQDRYILIEDKNLADFYAEFITRVQEFSLLIRQNDEVSLYKSWNILPYEGTKKEFITIAKNRIIEYMQDVFKKQQLGLDQQKGADTWIFPLIEMGQIGIHHDSIVTKQLFCTSLNGSRFKLATGYFNLTKEYMETLSNNCLAQCSILMAHPNANGFQGAKGPAGSIPAAYSLIAKNFYENIVERKQEHRVNFFEYEKDGWTYHAKGLWYYLPSCRYPNLTIIGSSNFGERSVNRDLETQICLVTENSCLSARLQTEADRLFILSQTAEQKIILRHVPRWIQVAVKIFRNFF